jgi:hypothetical protein
MWLGILLGSMHTYVYIWQKSHEMEMSYWGTYTQN